MKTNNPPIHGQKSVIIDIDGVLADFIKGFTELASRQFNYNIPIIPSIFHQVWNFKDIMTPQEENATWEHIHSHPDWWDTLRPMISLPVGGRLADISRQVPTYFVTHRPDAAHKATAHWLAEIIGVENPAVIMSKKKGEVAKLLNATHAIDDKLENAWCIHWLSDRPQTKVYLLDRPYNRIVIKVGVDTLYRVKNFEDFLEDVESVYL